MPTKEDAEFAYYRAIMPYEKLAEKCADKVEVRFDENPLGRYTDPKEAQEKGLLFPPDWEYENLKWCDVVVVNNITNFGGPYAARVIGKAKEFGKFVHFDTDDLLTELYPEHHLKEVYDKNKLGEITKFMYSHSDLVTVTQHKFAKRVAPYCKRMLAVVKNMVDYNLPCWNVDRDAIKSKPVRVGWAGGIHHRPDVLEFAAVPHLVNQKVGAENVRWDFYGHPPPGTPEKDQWQESIWKEYKAAFMKGFKGQKNWFIHYALPSDQYGVMYAHMDIAIAPLNMNAFNDSKCFGSGERLLLHNGNIKKVEDIVIGDILLGPKGEPKRVLETTTGEDELFEIIPKKGKSFNVTKNHILCLKLNDKKTLSWNNSKYTQYKNLTVENYLKSSKFIQTNYRLYRSEELEFGFSNNLKLDPYLVGIMLGDGSLTHGTCGITTADEKIENYFKTYVKTFFPELKVREDKKKNSKAKGLYATKKKRNSHISNPLLEIFGQIGLKDIKCENKFVPHEYKIAKKQERLNLLAGLLDTDGCLNLYKTFFTFSNKSKRLVEDTAFVARSLGLYVSPIKEFQVKKICDTYYYRIQISGDVDKIPCKLSRKLGNPRQCKRDPLTSSFNIKLLGKQKYYGFKVSGDGLILMDDFLVTHNSDIKVAEAGRYKVPLVASDVGCYSDTIKSWHGGVLIPAAAPKSDWVKVLSRLIKNHQLRKQMGENLHKITEALFNINDHIEDRYNLYEECFAQLNFDPRLTREDD